jgi:hypothetical protein
MGEPVGTTADVIPLLVAAVMFALLGPVLLAIGYLAGDSELFLAGAMGTVVGVAGVAFWQRHRRGGPDEASG